MQTQRTKPTVRLTGEDGNIFSILGRCRRALERSGYTEDEVNQFTREAMDSRSYDAAIQVVMKWCDVE